MTSRDRIPDRAELAVVGSFTSAAREARGKGISVLPHTGAGAEPLSSILTVENPSYVLADVHRDVVHAVHGDGTVVTSYTVDRGSGRIRELSCVPSGGVNGVAVAQHPGGRFLHVANYGSGSVSTVPVAGDGTLSAAESVLELPGEPGPHRAEQAGSHPHDARFDPSGRWLVVPDKGLDLVFVLRPDDATGALTVHSAARVRAGSGPRHVTFHPHLPCAYVVGEIDSTLTSLAWDADRGTLTPRHVVPALPDTAFAPSTAAEIVVDRSGRVAYVSNRGDDSITRIALGDDGLAMSVTGWTPSGGAVPRFMTLSPDAEHLLVANEQGDSIVTFAVDAATGDLTPVSSLASASPSALAFL